MEDVPPRMRFSEKIRWLIQRNTRFGGTAAVPGSTLDSLFRRVRAQLAAGALTSGVRTSSRRM